MSTSLRIAILVDPITARVKGSEHAPELARELLGRGHTVRGFGAPEGVIPRSGAEPSGGGGSDQGVTPGAFRPDRIVAYDASSPAAWRGARLARSLGVPLVLVEAGLLSGQPWYEKALWSLGHRLWGRRVRRAAGAVVALDPVAREEVVREGFARAHVSVLPQGVDLNLFRPGITTALTARHRVRGRILLYVGALEPGCGLTTLIKAFARTVGQREDWSLVIAGEGSELGFLRVTAERLGVSASVHFLPRARREELPGLIGSATLLAAPAVDDRLRGRSVAQAMACGRPVLVSDLPRLAHLVEHEGTGLVVPAGDEAAWIDALRRAAGAPEARKRWGQRGRALAEERLAWPVVAAAFEQVLLQTLEPALTPAPSPAAASSKE